MFKTKYFLFFALFISFFLFNFSSAEAATPIKGYAWSSGIGWISFNCENALICGLSPYGVYIRDDSTLGGYAWNDNVGWISFNSSDVSGCPSGACSAKVVAGGLSGWARVLIGSTASGWEGWIHLSGSGPAGPYRVNFDSGTGKFSGYSWSNGVAGWMAWSPSQGPGVFAVIGGSVSTPEPLCNDCIDNDNDGKVDWAGIDTNGDGVADTLPDQGCNNNPNDNSESEPILTVNVILQGAAKGKVLSFPTGINCGTDCSETYTGDEIVNLKALPLGISFFGGWGGACLGTGSCSVLMTTSRSVTALFKEGTTEPPGILPPPDSYGNCPADGPGKCPRCNDGVDNDNSGQCDYNGCTVDGAVLPADIKCQGVPDSNNEIGDWSEIEE